MKQHAELIKAWADGALIEVLDDGKWVPIVNPNWSCALVYRIKPEEKKPVVRWLWAGKNGRISANMYTEEECLEIKGLLAYPIKLEWSRTEFDE